jgi:hypothetical protein
MNLQPLLSWRPAWWLHAIVSLRAQRAIAEKNVF